MILWNNSAERHACIHNVTPLYLLQIKGNTLDVGTFGVQGNILIIFQFGSYAWCYFCEEGNLQFPMQKLQLGLVLGTMQNYVNEMTQAVLKLMVE